MPSRLSREPAPMSEGTKDKPRYYTRSAKSVRSIAPQDKSSESQEMTRQEPEMSMDILAASEDTLDTNSNSSASTERTESALSGAVSVAQVEGLSALLKYFVDKDEHERWDRAKQDADRLEFEAKRMDLDRELLLKKSRQLACQQLKNWDDQTDPEAYLANFEHVMDEAKLPKTEWTGIIRKQLTGKALLAFQELAPDPVMPYDKFKAEIQQLGATIKADSVASMA